VQVEPLKPVLKAPLSMLSKLRYDGPLSNIAFNFNLRRYAEAEEDAAAGAVSSYSCGGNGQWERALVALARMVGRCCSQ